jgi:hypothetical protein
VSRFEGKAYSVSLRLDDEAAINLGERLPLVGEQLP